MFNRDLTHVRGYNPGEGAELTSMKFIEKKLDLGDIIGITGHLFRTHKGELTVFVKEVVLLCKSLLPLPDKHSGLADKGIRYKKRYLDLIINPEVDRRFRIRSQLIRLTRRFFEDRGFLEGANRSKHTGGISETHIFSPSVLNVATIGYARARASLAVPPAISIPAN